MKIRSVLVGAVCTVVLALVAGTVVFGRGQPSPSVRLGAGSAWFPTESQGSLALLDGATGSRVTRVDNAGAPGGDFTVEQSGTSALIVDRDLGTITKVDGATWTPSRPVQLVSGKDPQLRVVTAGDTAWVLSQGQTVVQQLDTRSMTLIGSSQTLPGNASDLGVAPDGTLWVVSGSGEVRSFREGRQATDAHLRSGGSYGLALAGDRPVVVDLATSLATLIDPGNGTPGDDVCLDAPTTVPPLVGDSSEDASWLLAVAPTAGSLVVSDLDAQQCQAVPLGPTATSNRYGVPVENDRLVFVPDDVSGQVIVVDPLATGDRIKARIDLGIANSEIALLVHDHHVWFNEVNGDRAGVITDGLTALGASKAEAGSAPGEKTKAAAGGPGAAGGQQAATNGAAVAGAPRAAPVAAPPTPSGSPLPAPAANGGAGGAGGGAGDLPAPDPNAGAGAADGGGGGGPDGGGAGEGTVDFTASPATAQVGETVTFTDTTTGEHTVTGWAAPDGNPVASTNGASRFQTVFKAPGSFDVTLTVDAAGGARSVTHQIKVDTELRVPDLHGLSFAQAQKALNDIGLALGNRTADIESLLPSGAVVDTDPKAGTTVARGTAVNFRASTSLAYAEFALPSSNPNGLAPGITVGPDGNVWFTGFTNNKVTRVTPEGRVTEFEVPVANAVPWGIVVGPDNHLWVTLAGSSQIAQLTVTGDNVHFELHPTRGVNQSPLGITVGPDRNLWVAMPGNDSIEVFNLGGQPVRDLPVDGGGPDVNPREVALSTDGFVYVTEPSPRRIARFGVDGQIDSFAIPDPPVKLVPGQAGQVLFTTDRGHGTIDRSRSPVVRYSLVAAQGATVGSDGNVWFTTNSESLVAVDGIDRQIRTAPANLTGKRPAMVIDGPGRMLWFIEQQAGRIARVVI